MRRGRRPKAKLELSEAERTQLESLARSRSLPAALTARARLVLGCAAGRSNSQMAREVHLTRATVGKWRARFIERRLGGLYDEVRPGRPRTIDEERVAELINMTLHCKPASESTHWSVREAAEASGLSKSSVHRLFQLFELKPHRSESFKLSTDPFFIEKLRDVVGLYLSPPEEALVLCLDEKSQLQALERTQPALPAGIGVVATRTHDYVRHGTTTLFAALDVASGAVIGTCKPRHRHQEFLAFLRQIESAVPEGLECHVILDNYSTHKHPRVKRWLARHPRWHFHFVPTYSSWLNLVERFFALLAQKAIHRGSFPSVRALVEKIDRFIARYNEHCRPFVWTATADEILAKLTRLCSRINGTAH